MKIKLDGIRVKLPNNELILYALALAQTLGIAYASVMYESGNGNWLLMGLAGLRGLLLGASLSFGLAVAAQRAPRVQSKRARIIGFWALGGLLVVSPVIMAPAIVAAMPGTMMSVLSPLTMWVVGIALAIAPDFVAVAVATQSGSLQSAESEPAGAEPAQSEKKPARSEAKPSQVFVCATCQREFGSQNALNAHERAHKRSAEQI